MTRFSGFQAWRSSPADGPPRWSGFRRVFARAGRDARDGGRNMDKVRGFLVFQMTVKTWGEFTALLEDYPHVTWRFFRDVPYWWVEVGGRLTPKEKRRIARRLYLIATRTGARCLPVHSALNEAFWNLGEVSADSAADLL